MKHIVKYKCVYHLAASVEADIDIDNKIADLWIYW